MRHRGDLDGTASLTRDVAASLLVIAVDRPAATNDMHYCERDSRLEPNELSGSLRSIHLAN